MADETTGTTRAAADERARAAAERTSSAVRMAAGVLEEEVSAGVQEARRLQRTLLEQRRLEPGDLEEVAARVRRNAHQLIDLVAERFGDLRADDVQELGQRFAKDAHEVFDAVMDLVDVAPDVVNRLVERAEEMTAPAGEGAAATTGKATAKKATAKKATAKKATAKKAAARTSATKATTTRTARTGAAKTTG